MTRQPRLVRILTHELNEGDHHGEIHRIISRIPAILGDPNMSSDGSEKRPHLPQIGRLRVTSLTGFYLHGHAMEELILFGSDMRPIMMKCTSTM